MAANIIISAIVISTLFVMLYWEFWRMRTGILTLASFPVARREMLNVLTGDIRKRTEIRPYTIIDMGSGCGQLCRQIARNLPDAQVAGVEISPLPWLVSVLCRALFGPRNVRFVRRDFWSFDISGADAVVMLLEASFADRLGQKLHRELKPESLVVSNEVALGDGWEPYEVRPVKLFNVRPINIYVYRQAIT